MRLRVSLEIYIFDIFSPENLIDDSNEHDKIFHQNLLGMERNYSKYKKKQKTKQEKRKRKQKLNTNKKKQQNTQTKNCKHRRISKDSHSFFIFVVIKDTPNRGRHSFVLSVFHFYLRTFQILKIQQ